jgi:hypothetical protein
MQSCSTISASKFILCLNSIVFISEHNITLFFRAFDNPSEDELSEIVRYVQDLPYEEDSKYPQQNQAIISFSKHIKVYHCSV